MYSLKFSYSPNRISVVLGASIGDYDGCTIGLAKEADSCRRYYFRKRFDAVRHPVQKWQAMAVPCGQNAHNKD